MASVTFKQFLGKFGIIMFPFADASLEPGALIEKKKRAYLPVGHLRNQIVGSWTSVLEDANLVTSKVSRSLSLEGKGSLNQFGVQIQSGLNRAKRVSFDISGVRARKLKDMTELQIASLLDNLKDVDKKQWKRIKKLRVAISLLYASEFTAEFEVEGNINLKSETDGNIVAGSANLEWMSEKKIKISTNGQIPFGFTSLKV